MAAEKQLIVAVEGTAAMGPYWRTIVSDYLEKIIRSFCDVDPSGQKPSATNFELTLVMYNAHGSYSGCLVQRTGWTSDIDIFMKWLSALRFTGGGFNNAAIAEGLSEALMMLPVSQNGSQNQQGVKGYNKHCILVAASNPYPLPTPVYRPVLKLEKSENGEAQTESRLYDAEAVATSFSQCSFSLSVICPKQLPKLRAIYNAGKHNPESEVPPVDTVKNPYYLVLISEKFLEARTALSHPITSSPTIQSPVKMEIASVPSPPSGPTPTSIQSVNESIMNWQPTSAASPTATVKTEPTTLTSLAFPHNPSLSQGKQPTLPISSSPAASQEKISDGENGQESKPIVNHISNNMSQSVRTVNSVPANVNILNNLSQARQALNSAALARGTSIGIPSKNSMTMHMSNMISSGMQSSVPPQNAHSSGASLGQVSGSMTQGNLSGLQMSQSESGMNQNTMSGTMMPTPGMVGQQVPSGMQSITPNNNLEANNMASSQRASSALQSAQSKYRKIWEGSLYGLKDGQPIFITGLEAYRNAASSPETLAANWPPNLQMYRLIPNDHMNNKQFAGKSDFLVFRAKNQHVFLGHLQEKKLSVVIRLPSQTLLLSVSDKACRLIGMLYPGTSCFKDSDIIRTHISSQHQQQQVLQLQTTQQQQQQRMVGNGMGQSHALIPGRSQLGSQGQVSSQGAPNQPRGGDLS